MTKNNAAQASENARHQEANSEANLDSRYVAAALRYSETAKNPAYAPCVHQLEKWIADMAA